MSTANCSRKRRLKKRPRSSEVSDDVKFDWTVDLKDLSHDVFVSAVATGDGISAPFWPTAKPYQPDSPDWSPKTLGVSGAIWIDVDGNGKTDSARQIAQSRMALFDGENVRELFASLKDDHQSVAAQVAFLLNEQGVTPVDDRLEAPLTDSPKNVVTGFHAFAEAWKESQIARARK